MSAIWFLGDNHAHFDHIDQAIADAKVKPSAVIFLGDIEAPIPLEHCIENILRADVQVYWIRGNHDTDTEENWRNLLSPKAMGRNIDGKIVEIDGVKIAGLGGVFRGEIWYPRASSNAEAIAPRFRSYDEYRKDLQQKQGLKRRLSKMDIVQGQAIPDRLALLVDETRNGKLRKHSSSIFPDTYAALARQRADILVTHEAPSCHPHGVAVIDELARSMRCKMAVHGHHHDCLDYSPAFSALGFNAFGVGFCGITSLDLASWKMECVLEGDFDANRKFREQHLRSTP